MKKQNLTHQTLFNSARPHPLLSCKIFSSFRPPKVKVAPSAWTRNTSPIVKLKGKPICCENSPRQLAKRRWESQCSHGWRHQSLHHYHIKLKDITIIINNENEYLIINPYEFNFKDISFFIWCALYLSSRYHIGTKMKISLSILHLNWFLNLWSTNPICPHISNCIHNRWIFDTEMLVYMTYLSFLSTSDSLSLSLKT